MTGEGQCILESDLTDSTLSQYGHALLCIPSLKKLQSLLIMAMFKMFILQLFEILFTLIILLDLEESHI